MKHIISTLALITAFGAPAAFAGGDGDCHFHGAKPATEATVLGCANQRKESLVGSGKIDKS